jgi:DNA-binding CsgD family transcriptional regulator
MPDPSLLEREPQLAALHELLSGARAGEGGSATIVAPAGLGKSRLLAEAAALARDADMEVVAARGDELEREFSFGVVLSLLGPAVARADEAERTRLLRGAAGLAAPLVAGVRPAEALASEQQAFSLLHGLHWLVANLAERRPLLVAVDDAHWADEMSLRFVHYLLQRVDELPVALLVAARPESEVGPGSSGGSRGIGSHARSSSSRSPTRPWPARARAARRGRRGRVLRRLRAGEREQPVLPRRAALRPERRRPAAHRGVRVRRRGCRRRRGGAGRPAPPGRARARRRRPRPRRARSRGRDALTPPEHQIAELAAGGASNREIAEALFVTRKTVEAHLAAAYRKLDVSSRRELADRLDAPDPLEVPQ